MSQFGSNWWNSMFGKRQAMALVVGLLGGCASLPPQEHEMAAAQGGESVYSDCNGKLVSADRAGPTVTMLPPTSFRLVTWNVFKQKRAGWDTDLRRVAFDADVVALQEAALIPTLETALLAKDYRWDMSTAFLRSDGAPVGVLTAGKATSEQVCSVSALEPLLRLPKKIVITRYGIADRSDTLLVANVHFVNFTIGTSRFQAQLDALRDAVLSHSGPLVVVGDFNTWNSSRNDMLEEFAQQLQLESVHFETDERSRFFGAAVDHILFRGLDVRHSATQAVSSSDHNPLTVEFSFTPAT